MKNMKRMDGKVLKSTAAALLPLMAASLPFSVPGWAIVDNTSNPNSVNVSALKAGPVHCDNFCDLLVKNLSGDEKGGEWTNKAERDRQTVGPESGQGGWFRADDQWCANHGYVTDPTVQPETVSVKTDAKCNVTMLQSDSDCKTVNDNIFRCQMHNSQVIPQCLAYKATEEASIWQLRLAALDTVAAATCWTACSGATVYTAGAAELACQAAGAADTVTNLLALNAMKQGSVARSLEGIGTLVGGIATVANVANAGDGAGNNWGIGAGDNVGIKEGDSTNTGRQKKAACTAAVAFTVLAGVRYTNYGFNHNNMGNACKAVQDLASEVLTGNPGLAGNQGGGAQTGFSGISTGSGGVGANGSGGGNGGSSARVAGSDGQNSACPNGTCEVPSNLSAATDGGLLSNTGLDKLVGRPAADVASAFQNGATPAQALQSALSPGGAFGSDGIGAISSLAQAAQTDGEALGGKMGMGASSGAMYAGGGGSGSARSGGDSNPFGNLFGGAGAGAGMGARTTASTEFGKGARVMDIWHTGTSQNLFEIVSDKVSKVAGRVGVR